MVRIPPVTKNLLIINVLAFIATYVFRMRGIDLNGLLGLHFFLAPNFNVTQLFTYMFMHGGFTHLFFNMFALWMFGCVIENTLGQKRFVIYYIVCGVGAGLIQELAQLGEFYAMAYDQIPYFSLSGTMQLAHNSSAVLSMWTTVGASGAIYGILLAFGMLYPNERIFIFPLPVPIKGKWFVVIYIVIELFSAFGTSGSGVAHFAHLGGMLFGFLLLRYWRSHPGPGSFGSSGGRRFFEGLKRRWEQRKDRSADMAEPHGGRQGESDWDYNARKKAGEDEIDRILDKIKRSGYDSLTEKEKQRLFNGGK